MDKFLDIRNFDNSFFHIQRNRCDKMCAYCFFFIPNYFKKKGEDWTHFDSTLHILYNKRTKKKMNKIRNKKGKNTLQHIQMNNLITFIRDTFR